MEVIPNAEGGISIYSLGLPVPPSINNSIICVSVSVVVNTAAFGLATDNVGAGAVDASEGQTLIGTSLFRSVFPNNGELVSLG